MKISKDLYYTLRFSAIIFFWGSLAWMVQTLFNPRYSFQFWWIVAGLIPYGVINLTLYRDDSTDERKPIIAVKNNFLAGFLLIFSAMLFPAAFVFGIFAPAGWMAAIAFVIAFAVFISVMVFFS